MLKKPKISVILPTYNEEGNIVPLIESIHGELNGWAHEIIVVDDQSEDRTVASIRQMKAAYVQVVIRQSGRSLGKSIRMGIELSTGDICAVMDSDFNHQTKYLPFMIKALSVYDVVFASRFIYGGGMEQKSRHILSLLFNRFICLMTGGQLTDSLYGYFVIRREVLASLNYDDIFWGYGDYCIRLAYYLQKMKTPILQIPAQHGTRLSGRGNVRFVHVFIMYVRTVWALFLIGRLKTSKIDQINYEKQLGTSCRY